MATRLVEAWRSRSRRRRALRNRRLMEMGQSLYRDEPGRSDSDR
jgi:hypothetical protein